MAVSKKFKRVFLIHQCDIDGKACNKTVKFRNDDKIVILTTETSLKLSQNLLDFFENKEELLNPEKQIVIEYLRNNNSGTETVYYFIGQTIKNLYEEIGNELMLFSKGIAYNDTFGVSKVPIEKPTQSEISSLESSFQFITESLNQFTNENNTNEEETENKKNCPKKPKENKSNRLSNKKEDTSKKEDKNTVKEEKSSKNSNEDTSIELTISEQCMHAKAAVVSCLFKRFEEHLAVYTKRKLEFKDCRIFLDLLLRTDDLEDFKTSWRCQHPDSRIDLSTEYFLKLRYEAMYWEKVAVLFYKEDLWNY